MAAMRVREHLAIILALGCAALFVLPAAAKAGILSSSTPLLVFGPVAVGAHYEESVAISNEGETTRIESTSIAGPDASQFEIAAAGTDCEPETMLGNEQSCTINIAYHPTGTGSREATLMVVSDANPIEVTLQGEGIAPELSITPSTFDFGSVGAGSKSALRVFAVRNVGSDVAVVGSVGVGGGEPGQFRVESDGCSSKNLGVGAECSVGIVFAPTSAGAKSATLEVPSNSPESRAAAALSGTAVSLVPAPLRAVAPAKPSNAFGFGKVIHNKRRGTASLPVRVPGPGSVLLRGKGLIARNGPGSALVLGGAGTARLAIVPTGRKERSLIRRGRAKIVARITYVPAGGDPLTKVKKIRLVRRR